MKVVLWCVVMVVLFSLVVVGYSLGKQQPEAPKKISNLETQVKILRLLRKQDQINGEYSKCTTEVIQLPQEFMKIEGEKQGLINEAYKAEGLKRDEYDLNIETFEFTKKLLPPQPPAPEKKPEPEKKKD